MSVKVPAVKTPTTVAKEHYEYGVVIGRFQPFHIGHVALLQRAAELCDTLVVVIGTSNSPRTIKNPFIFSERAAMIQTWASAALPGKMVFTLPVEDNLYAEIDWKQDVVKMVQSVTGGVDASTALIGFEKDRSSYYLKEFPMWDYAGISEGYYRGLDATAIRSDVFLNRRVETPYAVENCPATTIDVMKRMNPEILENLGDEFDHIKRYKLAWERAPYKPTFVTVDAVVHCNGYVLMVTRGAKPGKGLKALPGGFLNQDETTETGVLRELKEETHLKVDRSDIIYSRLFDHPDRSLRGRTVTHAFLMDVSSKYPHPPLVKGGDDAARADWVWIPDLKRSDIFEDHLDVIKALVKQL